ncbi:hypothetical protein [Falsiroseomonas sp.]|uniref:hypothetical protein n=1 Tax=Falsiroseomonas sp. TaxID=2870721 RepID=UPI003567A9E3
MSDHPNPNGRRLRTPLRHEPREAQHHSAAVEALEAGMLHKLLAAAVLFALVALLSRLLAASVGVVLYLILGGALLAICAAAMERARR